MMRGGSRQRGFTIIEVVLVLAIAGLIFLIVFVALPQLQASRRDTQRRSDFNRLYGLITNFATNNRNIYPGNDQDIEAFNDHYLTYETKLLDPSSGDIYYLTWGDFWPTEYPEIFYNNRSRCDPKEGIIVEPAGENLGLNDFALAMKLERGYICQDNRTH